MKYAEVLEYMESLNSHGIVPGLDSIRGLCDRLGNPQDSLTILHIAGTNGKGSVLAYLSTILKNAGYRVGLYLSPTIFEYRERIQAGGRPITQKALCELVERLKGCCEEMVREGLPHPTAFEVETAMAFCYFATQGCDIVVLETGMGGRLDATNIVRHTKLAILTSISMDHMKFLGGTLEQIAAEKAGIIKPGCRLVTAKQAPEAERVIRKQAKILGVPVTIADPGQASHIRYGVERQSFDLGEWKKLEISLAGTWQIENAVLAVTAVCELERMGFSVGEKALRRGLLETVWPGRFSVIAKKPLFIADGAHNEDAAKKLASSIEFYFTNRRIIYIMGVLRDKDYEKIIELTHALADQIITFRVPDNPRAMDGYELAAEAARFHPRVSAVDSLEEAVEMSYLMAGRNDVIIAFGSLSYLGKLIRIVERLNAGRPDGKRVAAKKRGHREGHGKRV